MKRICILSFSPIAWDGRVLREIEYARREFSVDVIGYGDWSPPQGVRYFQLPKTKRSRAWLARYATALVIGKLVPSTYDRLFWMKNEYVAARQLLERGNYDLIHANDWDGLPVGSAAVRGSGTSLIWDAHEYSLAQGAESALWRQFMAPYREHLFRLYFPDVDQMINASVEYGRLYERKFGWDSLPILNVPDYQEIPFRATDPNNIHIIHHGVAMPNRCIEEMIKAIALSDTRFHLDIMLVATSHPAYYQQLKAFAQERAYGRVTFHDAVQPAQIVRKVAEFDLGLPLLKVLQVSHLNSQPNKFFEYIMAGLGIITPPYPGMMPIVQAHQNGIIAPDFTAQSVAETLNSLTSAQIDAFKRSSLELAHTYNADVELGKLMSLYHRLIA